MEAAGALIAAAPNLGSILGSVVVIGTLLSDQTPILPSSRMGGIKLQLLCGVRIELAVGSLPCPAMIRIPGSVLDETGNYLDSQFVSPVWT